MNIAKLVVSALLVISSLFAFSGIAAAHDPIFVEDSQTTPDTGPYMPDGTISWALYGTVLESGDTRGFEFDLRDGDELYISLLIPNLEPEISLTDDELPVLELESPDGQTVTLTPDMREPFDEQFSKTSYVTLLEQREPGQAGRYRGIVVGNAPSRFTVAIGEREVFFTETERSGDRPSTFPEISAPLRAWYTTAPGEEPATDTDSDAGEVQMDQIDEAIESGDVEGVVSQDESTNDETDQETSEDEANQDETAASATEEDDNSSSTNFIAPIVLVAALAAGGFWFIRRKPAGE